MKYLKMSCHWENLKVKIFLFIVPLLPFSLLSFFLSAEGEHAIKTKFGVNDTVRLRTRHSRLNSFKIKSHISLY